MGTHGDDRLWGGGSGRGRRPEGVPDEGWLDGGATLKAHEQSAAKDTV